MSILRVRNHPITVTGRLAVTRGSEGNVSRLCVEAGEERQRKKERGDGEKGSGGEGRWAVC